MVSNISVKRFSSASTFCLASAPSSFFIRDKKRCFMLSNASPASTPASAFCTASESSALAAPSGVSAANSAQNACTRPSALASASASPLAFFSCCKSGIKLESRLREACIASLWLMAALRCASTAINSSMTAGSPLRFCTAVLTNSGFCRMNFASNMPRLSLWVMVKMLRPGMPFVHPRPCFQ